MYYTYIIYSAKLDRYYVGQTENLNIRLGNHNAGISRYSSAAKDWKIVYHEEFPSRSLAIKRENEIKKRKSRKYIEWLIQNFKNK